MDPGRDSHRERERSAEPRASEYTTFVGGISWQTTDQELGDSEHFAPAMRRTKCSVTMSAYACWVGPMRFKLQQSQITWAGC